MDGSGRGVIVGFVACSNTEELANERELVEGEELATAISAACARSIANFTGSQLSIPE